MLTVMMECHNHESELAQTLSGLVSAAVEGLVSDVVVLDHGSLDGTSRVADAAGCRFHTRWDITDVLRTVRGEWLLLLEPGARLQNGWIEEVLEYTALNRQPARFSPSRSYRRPFFKRFGRSVPPLEYGFLIPKKQAIALSRTGMGLEAISSGQKTCRLASEVIPSWVAAAVR